MILCLLLSPALADSGRSGSWIWDAYVAFTQFRNGINIGIAFIPASQCNRAQLLITGNDKIAEIALDVDGVGSEPMTVTRTADGVHIDLEKLQLQRLKTGSNAALLTDQGSLTITLEGSAKAINEAWRNCETMIGEQQPSRSVDNDVNAASQNHGAAGNGVFVTEGNIQALGDVIFIFQSIDGEDAQIVKRIAGLMRNQGTRLSSVIFFNNNGGSLGAAMQLGRTIRDLGANTAASYACASACIYAFSGGVIRTSYANSRFGLHQTRYGDGSLGTLSDGQKIAATRYSYLEQMGVNPKVAIWESEVEPDDIRWISQYEAKGLNLVNRILENYEFPN